MLVIVLVITVPMVVSGFMSASWISAQMERSIEHWLRESAGENRTWLVALHHNHQLFAEVLKHETRQPILENGASPIPPTLAPLTQQFWITLIQVRSADGTLLYSSLPADKEPWQFTGTETIIPVTQNGKRLLAAVTTLPVSHHYLILGTLFDKEFLQRLDQMSGIKTRLFYPENGDFTKAFSEESQPLRLRLPSTAFAQLMKKQDYYSNNAEDGSYFGLYSPIVGSTGQVEAVLFSGVAHHGSDELLTDRLALTLVLIVLGTTFAVIVGFMLSRIVVRPVQYLHRGVLKVAAQDFQTEIPFHSNDELGELAQAFNMMAEHLRDSRDAERREFQRDKIAALGEMSLAMAHEIRNPIGVISTAAQLLNDHPDKGRQSQLLRVIGEESKRLNQLLHDFQQLARHRQPEFTPVDPIQPLEDALRTMLAGRDEIQVVREYRHGHALVRADALLLHQAWTNLIRNALEAMGTGPGKLLLTSWAEQNDLIVAMEDSGPGIPVSLMGRLFEPFFTTKLEGTGLGLPIASTLVQANEGRLELLPPQQGGARFAMRLPLFWERK
jgi:signal transduction histidine kinase